MRAVWIWATMDGEDGGVELERIEFELLKSGSECERVRDETEARLWKE